MGEEQKGEESLAVLKTWVFQGGDAVVLKGRS